MGTEVGDHSDSSSRCFHPHLPPLASPSSAPTVALFRGCVMDALFGHVHAATRRTLEANGYRVVESAGQGCCGALHEHAGDRAGARALAAANLEALADRPTSWW